MSTIVLPEIQVVPYKAEYAELFRILNETWIKKYFFLEASDIWTLNNPESAIINKGGCILVALFKSKPVGVCALIPHGTACYELTKLAVDEYLRGKGIGKLLVHAAIFKAKQLNAESIHLYSNTKLEPAISLYRKIGFVEVACCSSQYERCNIQMHFSLTSDHHE
jgi:ribosomal protein S18 acetylase RimI-like enzyme